MFDDDRLPKQYEQTGRGVPRQTRRATSPSIRPWEMGLDDLQRTQWDLNWANPQVFLENRRDHAVPCETGRRCAAAGCGGLHVETDGHALPSEPEVHMLLQALRAVCRVVCPAVIHLEEAIVAPARCCPIWAGGGMTARRQPCLPQQPDGAVLGGLGHAGHAMMGHVLRTHFPDRLTNATYATYIRCHDDIGWAVTDEDAAAMGMTGQGHRASCRISIRGVSGVVSAGALFQENRRRGTSGFRAPLPRLRAGAGAGGGGCGGRMNWRAAHPDGACADRGLRGHPAGLHGRRVALTNDWGYLDVPEHAHDSRWVHRPRRDWAAAAGREVAQTPAARVFRGGAADSGAAEAVAGAACGQPHGGARHGQRGAVRGARKARPGPSCVCSTSPRGGSTSGGLGARAGGAGDA